MSTPHNRSMLSDQYWCLQILILLMPVLNPYNNRGKINMIFKHLSINFTVLARDTNLKLFELILIYRLTCLMHFWRFFQSCQLFTPLVGSWCFQCRLLYKISLVSIWISYDLLKKKYKMWLLFFNHWQLRSSVLCVPLLMNWGMLLDFFMNNHDPIVMNVLKLKEKMWKRRNKQTLHNFS